MDENKKDQYLLKSLDTSLAILRLFEQGCPLSFAQVIQQSGLNRTVVFRILYTLAKRGFLMLKEDGRYAPGIHLAVLGAKVDLDDTIRELAAPFLQKCSQTVNETVHFTKRLNKQEVILLDEILPQRTLLVLTAQYDSRPMHMCSTGMAILSTVNAEELDAYIKRATFEKRTDHSIADAAQLVKELEAVRLRGYAINDQFYESGICSIAVPVYGADRANAQYAISVSGPSQRINIKMEQVIKELQAVSQQLETILT